MTPTLPLSEPVRLNEIGKGLDRTLEPDAAARAKIAKALDLASLDAFVADLSVAPAANAGYRLTGRVRASAVQTCGITLEPLPVEIDQRFSIDLVEAVDPIETDEIEITLDDDAPDIIEDGRIDLGQYAVEQLVLTLDPFPRKPGAEFVQPDEPAEISPFAVLKQFKAKDAGET
ncbi:DUF177 domain-containing protein [Brevundimonas sp.]|uniref:YceD family protein n=1 Tax=Brevundimonas sp. TaxID=1871086 RepID=UPI001A26C558|nr:DUF177 domain-containing protein [Brevundimonas sp.]MBJ7485353.1 DUF177 domain-containing protein [Brevundimonas sp.]